MSKQTRDSAQAASEKHPTTGSLPVQETYLTVRLWSSNGSGGSIPMPLESDSPAISMTTDLIAASKGASVTNRDGLLLTSFHAVLPAVSTARRLQWAIQGLAEGRDLRGTAIAVLIHYAHDLPVQTGETAVRDALEQATPGQILLTESIAKSFDDLPGFPSRALDKSGLLELLWRAPEAQTTRSFDEQILTQLLEQQGLQDDVPEEPIAAPVPERRVDFEERAQAPGFLSRVKSPLGIGIAVAAVLLVAAFFIFRSTAGKSKPSTEDTTQAANNSLSVGASPNAQPPSQPPADTGKTSASSAPPTSAAPQLSAAEKRRQERLQKEQERNAKTSQAKTVTPPPPPPQKTAEEKPDKAVAHGCDEDAGQYSRLFDKGRTYYSQGHYSDAVRVFSEVVRCQPGNGQAREWLGKAQHEKENE